jgi:drug/metabolite transporter (DMT)-like permease
MPRTREPVLVPLATAATLVMWASAFVGIRAVGDDVGAGALAFARLALAATVLAAVVAVRRPAWPARADLVRLAICGALWPGAYFLLLNAAERHVDAGTASILVKVAPVLVAIGAGAMLGEGLPRRLVAGSVIALAGVVVVGAGGRSDAVGVSLGLGAAVAYATGVLLQKPVLPRTTPLVAATTGTATGAFVSAPFAPDLVGRLPDLSGGSLAWIVYLGIFPTAIAFTTWAYALTRTTAGRMTTYTYLVPPITIVISWWALSETPGPRALAGGAISLCGVALACLGMPRRRPRESRSGQSDPSVNSARRTSMSTCSSEVPNSGETGLVSRSSTSATPRGSSSSGDSSTSARCTS